MSSDFLTAANSYGRWQGWIRDIRKEHPELKGNALLVHLHLYLRCWPSERNGEYRCWPGIKSLSESTGLTANSIRTAIGKLVEAKLLTKRKVSMPGSPGASYEYILCRRGVPLRVTDDPPDNHSKSEQLSTNDKEPNSANSELNGSKSEQPLRKNCALRREDKKKKKGGGAAKRGTRLPDDWILTSEYEEFARSEGLKHSDIEREADKFRDHFHSVPGQRGVKLDWLATWRNWIRRDVTPDKKREAVVSKWKVTGDESHAVRKMGADLNTLLAIEKDYRKLRDSGGRHQPFIEFATRWLEGRKDDD